MCECLKKGSIVFFLSLDAKVNIRDYHGKMAAHYWNGSMDIFNKHGSHSGKSVYSLLHKFSLQFYYDNTVNIKCFHCLIGCLRCLTVAFLQSAGRWSGGRRGQCYTQLSALLSRSRSHGNISVEMCAHSPLIRMSQTPSPWYQQMLVKIVKKYTNMNNNDTATEPQQRSNQIMVSLNRLSNLIFHATNISEIWSLQNSNTILMSVFFYHHLF